MCHMMPQHSWLFTDRTRSHMPLQDRSEWEALGSLGNLAPASLSCTTL